MTRSVWHPLRQRWSRARRSRSTTSTACTLARREIEANLAAGKPFVIRQNIPNEGTTTFHDELYGDITVENAELDDMILIKSDGYPTYNFANVVDDHTMNITHVVRGNEYLLLSTEVSASL